MKLVFKEGELRIRNGVFSDNVDGSLAANAEVIYEAIEGNGFSVPGSDPDPDLSTMQILSAQWGGKLEVPKNRPKQIAPKDAVN